MQRDAHCSFCGARFVEGLAWPRTCGQCQQISYKNPLPVAVAVVPVGQGLLTIRRSIPPREGQLALPGGFIGVGESWQQAAVRELQEETGIEVDASRVQLFDALSAPDGTLLVFGILQPGLESQELGDFQANEEVSERVVLDEPTAMAFPLHEQVVARFFSRQA